uniref:Uncharacterized protein n=1 Tax=Arundo donax TaxID=35708 RepID=A0A0A9FZM4_ARUDO
MWRCRILGCCLDVCLIHVPLGERGITSAWCPLSQTLDRSNRKHVSVQTRKDILSIYVVTWELMQLVQLGAKMVRSLVRSLGVHSCIPEHAQMRGMQMLESEE